MSVLVLAEVDNGVLSPATARIVQAASQLGPLDILVPGSADAAAAAAALSPVRKVVRSDGNALADALSDVLFTLVPGYEYVVSGASSVGKDVMPRLAARLDIQPITDIVAIEGANRFTRPIYAGNALETLFDGQARHVLTFRASAFPPAPSGNAAPVEVLENPVASAAHFIAAHRSADDVIDLASARIVVGGGVSFGSAEGFRLVETLGKTLGAGIGATRAAVDAGYAPNDWQIGQTGKIIAPDLYIAIGISGALQHLAGIQGARKIVAINSDPEAPIVKIADVALIGDLFEIVPQLTSELEKLGIKR